MLSGPIELLKITLELSINFSKYLKQSCGLISD